MPLPNRIDTPRVIAVLALLVSAACTPSAPPPALVPPTTPPTPSPMLAPPPVVKPAVEIEFPAEGSHTRTHMVLVRGRAIGVQELFLNSDKVSCRKDGSFQYQIELSAGRPEIVARDRLRPDDVLLVRRVTIDLNAPMLELVELPGEVDGGQLYRRRVVAPRVTLRGRASDAKPGLIASVTIGGQACALAEDGTFQVEVDAPLEGEKTLEVVAMDRAQNRARITLTLVRG